MAMVADARRHPAAATRRRWSRVGAETWVSTSDGAGHDSATGAHQAARREPGHCGVRRRQVRHRGTRRAGGPLMNDFVAWQRPAVYALATAAPASVRTHRGRPADHPARRRRRPRRRRLAPFLLAGPGDVANLAAGQVTGRRPHPGCIDAEATMMAHVELATPDLPWRYIPQPHAPGLVAVRPWLVLVVGTPAEVLLLADGRVQLTSQEVFEGRTLFDWHPLANAHRWAHVHTVAGAARSPG